MISLLRQLSRGTVRLHACRVIAMRYVCCPVATGAVLRDLGKEQSAEKSARAEHSCMPRSLWIEKSWFAHGVYCVAGKASLLEQLTRRLKHDEPKTSWFEVPLPNGELVTLQSMPFEDEY